MLHFFCNFAGKMCEMVKYGHSVLIFFLLLLAASCGENHEQMLLQLEELERQNRADSVMTNDSLAEALVSYFDAHGTANEQLRAHYILGRTYADMGEAPAAINAYLDAADCADTTATDCDYHTLSRVYGQMAGVLYKQSLIEDYIKACEKAVVYAWRDNDTLQALNESAYQLFGYEYLHEYDNVITLFDELFANYVKYYGDSIASTYCAIPFMSLVKKGDLVKAKEYLDLYEFKSGFFDEKHNIVNSKEAYYYQRGLLYLYLNKLDSAEYYFRKELAKGLDYTNQSMATHGLSLVFQQLNQLDSATKYGILSYEMNDSAYAQAATREVEIVSAQHVYTRHQRIAQKEHLIAEQKDKEVHNLYVVLILVAFIMTNIILWFIRRKKIAAIALNKKIEELRRSEYDLSHIKEERMECNLEIERMDRVISEQSGDIIRLQSICDGLEKTIAEEEMNLERKDSEIKILKQNENEFANIISDKKRDLAQMTIDVEVHKQHAEQLEMEVRELEIHIRDLNEELLQSRLKQQWANRDAEARLSESEDYCYYLEVFKACNELSGADFVRIDKLVEEKLPNFHRFIKSRKSGLNTNQYRLCLLFRLHVDVYQAAYLLGVSSSYISKISKDILLKFFNEKGNGLLLKKRLTAFDE